MKILHCCLASVYVDNYGYQENILPKVHKFQGHKVAILASTETFLENKTLGNLKASSYVTEDGIPITRVPYVKWLPLPIAKKIRKYQGIKNVLESFSPDIIFLHDVQFQNICDIIAYKKKHVNVKIFADSHTDTVNSGRSWLSMNILHRIIYKYFVRKSIPYVSHYWGTLPLRVDFYKNIYGIPSEKISFLPMGVDDIKIDVTKRDIYKNEIRKRFNIEQNDFVIISGGKLDKLKNTDKLIKAFNRLNNPKIKLILFGQPIQSFKDEFGALIESNDNIINLGWLPATETFKYLMTADLACFPGTHSTLWEECAGLGIPAIFKYWDGITHVNLNGNCMLLHEVSENILYERLNAISKQNDIEFKTMKGKAQSKETMSYFSYSQIAKKAINYE